MSKKIGRNDLCPCGSGTKYKKCCLHKEGTAPPEANQEIISVSSEVAKLQEAAIAKKETFKNVGVFLFISTAQGDGWLLELTDKDAVQVAKDGEKIDIEITESPETIEVNWSHRFEIKNKKFTTTTYADNSIEVHERFPHTAVNSAIQRINRSFSNQLLDSIHVD